MNDVLLLIGTLVAVLILLGWATVRWVRHAEEYNAARENETRLREMYRRDRSRTR